MSTATIPNGETKKRKAKTPPPAEKPAPAEWTKVLLCPIELPGPESPIAIRPKIDEAIQRKLLDRLPPIRTLGDLIELSRVSAAGLGTIHGLLDEDVAAIEASIVTFGKEHPDVAGDALNVLKLDQPKVATASPPAEPVAPTTEAPAATPDPKRDATLLAEMLESRAREIEAVEEAEEMAAAWRQTVADLAAAKDAEKQAREKKDAAYERVIRVIRDETTPLPLFNQNEKSPLGAAKPTAKNADPDAPKVSGNTQAWRALDLSALNEDNLKIRISAKQIEKLGAAGINNLGELRDKCQREFWFKDIAGIGPESAGKIGESLNEYLSINKAWDTEPAAATAEKPPEAAVPETPAAADAAPEATIDAAASPALAAGEFVALSTNELQEVLTEALGARIPPKVISEWHAHNKKLAQVWAQSKVAHAAGKLPADQVPDRPLFLEAHVNQNSHGAPASNGKA